MNKIPISFNYYGNNILVGYEFTELFALNLYIKRKRRGNSLLFRYSTNKVLVM